MAKSVPVGNIDIHLVRVLHLLLTEQSVSKTAIRLGVHQPAISSALRRLREITGDPLLVRAGVKMVPTDYARSLLVPVETILREAAKLIVDTRPFDPATSVHTFRLAAADYLDPTFLPRLLRHVRRAAPRADIEVRMLSGEFDYQRSLANGDIDLVIGNWLEPPGDLHIGQLIDDEIVCLVSDHHPAVRRPLTLKQYLNAEALAPTALHLGAVGVIEQHLRQLGYERNIRVRCTSFSLMPQIVGDSELILTTGRLFCARFADRLPVRIVACPVPFPPLRYYQLWHERSHRSGADQWLHTQVRDIARTLKYQERLLR